MQGTSQCKPLSGGLESRVEGGLGNGSHSLGMLPDVSVRHRVWRERSLGVERGETLTGIGEEPIFTPLWSNSV